MKYQEMRFNRREAKRILKLALDRQYSSPRQPETEISFSELSESARDANISEGNLEYAIEEYKAGTLRRKSRLKGLAKIAAVAAGLTVGIGSLYSWLNSRPEKPKEPEYVEAIVLSEREEFHYGCPQIDYTINFRTGNGNNYIANVSPGFFCNEGSDVREAIKEGTRIRIKSERLNSFDENTGTLYYRDIKVTIN